MKMFILLGISVSKHHSHLSQPLSSAISMPSNRNFNYNCTTIISTNFNSVSGLQQQSSSHFVSNYGGVGERSSSKRNTFKRTNRVDASVDDLLLDAQQFTECHGQSQHYEYNQPSSNLYVHQPIHYASQLRPNTSSCMSVANANNVNIRPHYRIHGAYDTRNSDGHNLGLSSGSISSRVMNDNCALLRSFRSSINIDSIKITNS